MSNEHFTYQEIISQPEAWAQGIELACAAPLPLVTSDELVIFTGCGSTYYLSLAAAALYQELTGRPARAVPGGELLLNPQTVFTTTAGGARQRVLLVAISRSGTTTETLKAVEKFKAEGRGAVLTISNHGETLAKLGDVNITIPGGQEQSVAQTRSFSSMYVAVTAVCARMAGRADLLDAISGLPAAGRRILKDCEPIARRLGEDLSLDRFYFLGSGIRYGLACEASLKMKEMSLTHSEPFPFLEFRHGPMSMVTTKTLMVGLLSEANRSHEKAVLSEMQALGGQVFALGETAADVNFDSKVPEALRSVLYLPTLQLMAFYRSLAKGLNPDRPTNLTSVVKLDLP